MGIGTDGGCCDGAMRSIVCEAAALVYLKRAQSRDVDLNVQLFGTSWLRISERHTISAQCKRASQRKEPFAYIVRLPASYKTQ